MLHALLPFFCCMQVTIFHELTHEPSKQILPIKSRRWGNLTWGRVTWTEGKAP